MADTTPTLVQPEDVLPVRSRISWGAVFAGAFVAFATYLILTMLAAAIGLSVQDRVRPETLGIGAAIVAIVTMAAALFLGGYVATRTAVGEDLCEAAIHGVLVWCILFAGIVAMAGTALNSAGFSTMIGMTLNSQAAADRMNQRGWEDAVRQAGLPQERIDELRKHIQAASNNAEDKGRDPANHPQTTSEEARRASIAVAWWTLFGTFLSMVCAIGGGMLGSGPTPQFAAIMSRTRVVRQDVTLPRA